MSAAVLLLSVLQKRKRSMGTAVLDRYLYISPGPLPHTVLEQIQVSSTPVSEQVPEMKGHWFPTSSFKASPAVQRDVCSSFRCLKEGTAGSVLPLPPLPCTYTTYSFKSNTCTTNKFRCLYLNLFVEHFAVFFFRSWWQLTVCSEEVIRLDGQKQWNSDTFKNKLWSIISSKALILQMFRIMTHRKKTTHSPRMLSRLFTSYSFTLQPKTVPTMAVKSELLQQLQ